MLELLVNLFAASLLANPSLETTLDSDYLPSREPVSIEITSDVSAESYAIFDAQTGSLIAGKKAEQKRAIASLTKLMTALLVMENYKPNELVTMSENEVWEMEPAKMYLLANETISLKNLMRGLLIPSANDAALAIAYYAAQEESEKEVERAQAIDYFAQKMTERAQMLGLKDTQFKNPHGLDAEGHYSTAHELALLGSYLLNRKDPVWDDFFRETIQISQMTVYSSDGAIDHELENTNDLLASSLPVFGMKTGTTDEAGQCLMTLLKTTNREIIIVVLGSEDRFSDTKSLAQEVISQL
jgi:D-alanyl-D-alanine carboxypeptidase (penicillin-binding protein 5/6)